MTVNVKAALVVDLFGSGGDAPGAFDYRGESPAAMRFRCPCGCGDLHRIAIRPHARDGEPSWSWNGNRDKPTLSPSLHLLEGDPDAPENEHSTRREDFKMRTHWHGWLRNGEFISC